MPPTDQQIETEIQAKGLNAPRVTPAHIESRIAEEYFFTAASALKGTPGETSVPCGLLTFCVLVMRNGFTVVGKSACASPANFDAELGKKIARQDAISQVWALEGYLLREQLATQPKTAKDRAVLERDQLADRLTKLDSFRGTPNYQALPSETQSLLEQQCGYMSGYLVVLNRRLAAWS